MINLKLFQFNIHLKSFNFSFSFVFALWILNKFMDLDYLLILLNFILLSLKIYDLSKYLIYSLLFASKSFCFVLYKESAYSFCLYSLSVFFLDINLSKHLSKCFISFLFLNIFFYFKFMKTSRTLRYLINKVKNKPHLN